MPAKFAPPRARVDYCHRDPVVLAFADLARIRRPGAAHQALWGRAGIRSRAPHAITAFLQERPERFAHWFGPMRAALAGVVDPEYSRALELRVARLDATDDLERVRYQEEPTPENARRLVAAMDRTVQELLRLRQALVSRHQLEGQ